MENGELRLGVDLGGTGTGGGIVVDERLVAGPGGIAGEWVYNPLPWPRAGELPGPACVFRAGGYRTGQGPARPFQWCSWFGMVVGAWLSRYKPYDFIYRQAPCISPAW